MKKKVLSIYLIISETLSFIRFESTDKKLVARLTALVQNIVTSQWVNAIDGNYSVIYSRLVPIAVELLFYKLKMLIEIVDMYKREYVGHATKVAPFVKNFEDIEPALEKGRSFINKILNKPDVWDGTVYDELGLLINEITCCKNNLQKQYGMWRYEVKADKRASLLVPVSASVLSALIFAALVKLWKIVQIYMPNC